MDLNSLLNLRQSFNTVVDLFADYPAIKTFAMRKIARISRGKHQKRGNKNSGESISPICYNVMNMYIYVSLLFR